MKFKVGDKVKIKGDVTDCTIRLDGQIGVVTRVNTNDYCVKVEGFESLLTELGWFIWEKNLSYA